jgi:hypothetical protein
MIEDQVEILINRALIRYGLITVDDVDESVVTEFSVYDDIEVKTPVQV